MNSFCKAIGDRAARGALVRRRFCRDETGSFSILTLFLLMCMMMVVGISVDVVRYESKRARLQNTLDRAILAAADMGQKLTPAQVVHSYFEKADLLDFYAAPTSSTGFNSKIVSATATGPLDTFFMNMLGINTLETTAVGTAEESISDIEISLVLDISGSMGEPVYEYYTKNYGSRVYKRNTGQDKLEALQDAAKEFVDTIFSSTADARTSMSIVPYAMQVNAGATLLSKYNVSNQNTLQTCIDFTDAQFNSTAVDPSSQIRRSDVFDRYNRAMPIQNDGSCSRTSYSEILPLGGDADKLKAKIDSLRHGGNTSIEIGVKWGTALLDPSAQPVVTALTQETDYVDSKGVTHYKVNPNLAGRPFSYDNVDTMKVMVVMTDGINTNEYIVNQNYRTGPSGVWRWWNGSQWRWSVEMPEGKNKSYDGDSIKNETYRRLNVNSGTDRWSNTPEGGASAVQLSYPELWQIMSFDYHAYYFRRNAWYNYPFSVSGLIDSSSRDNAWNDWNGVADDRYNGSTKDSRLNDICTAAKAQGIIIFTIGFEVTDDSADVLQSCASSPSHFYRVQGLEITTAFQSIANAIGKLRLTQ